MQLSTLAISNKHLVPNSDSNHVPAEFQLLSTLIANLWKEYNFNPLPVAKF